MGPTCWHATMMTLRYLKQYVRQAQALVMKT